MVRPQRDRSPTFWGQFLLGRGLTEKAISPSKNIVWQRHGWYLYGDETGVLLDALRLLPFFWSALLLPPLRLFLSKLDRLPVFQRKLAAPLAVAIGKMPLSRGTNG